MKHKQQVEDNRRVEEEKRKEQILDKVQNQQFIYMLESQTNQRMTQILENSTQALAVMSATKPTHHLR